MQGRHTLCGGRCRPIFLRNCPSRSRPVARRFTTLKLDVWTDCLLKFLPSGDRLVRESGVDGYAQCIAVDEQPPTRLRIECKSEVEYEWKNQLLCHRCDGNDVGDRVRNIVPTSSAG